MLFNPVVHLHSGRSEDCWKYTEENWMVKFCRKGLLPLNLPAFIYFFLDNSMMFIWLLDCTSPIEQRAGRGRDLLLKSMGTNSCLWQWNFVNAGYWINPVDQGFSTPPEWSYKVCVFMCTKRVGPIKVVLYTWWEWNGTWMLQAECFFPSRLVS